MGSIIMLTINGEIHFFKDIGLSLEEKKGIHNIAQAISQNNSYQSIKTENEIYKSFISEVKSCLGISLELVEVSFVVRINCRVSG